MSDSEQLIVSAAAGHCGRSRPRTQGIYISPSWVLAGIHVTPTRETLAPGPLGPDCLTGFKPTVQSRFSFQLGSPSGVLRRGGEKHHAKRRQICVSFINLLHSQVLFLFSSANALVWVQQCAGKVHRNFSTLVLIRSEHCQALVPSDPQGTTCIPGLVA